MLFSFFFQCFHEFMYLWVSFVAFSTLVLLIILCGVVKEGRLCVEALCLAGGCLIPFFFFLIFFSDLSVPIRLAVCLFFVRRFYFCLSLCLFSQLAWENSSIFTRIVARMSLDSTLIEHSLHMIRRFSLRAVGCDLFVFTLEV